MTLKGIYKNLPGAVIKTPPTRAAVKYIDMSTYRNPSVKARK